jgi:hypothetical protein
MLNGGLKAEREAHKPVMARFRAAFPALHSPTWPFKSESATYRGEDEVYDRD